MDEYNALNLLRLYRLIQSNDETQAHYNQLRIFGKI